MYDRSTGSLWHQSLSEPVLGPLADSGIKLELLPMLVTNWEDWVREHPDTTVLDIDTDIFPPEVYRSEEDPESAYYDYRQRPDTIYPVRDRSGSLPTKAEVLGLSLNGEARAYRLEFLLQKPVLNDSLGGLNVVVLTQEASGAARVYERGTQKFSLPQTDGSTLQPGGTLTDGEGQLWSVTEESLMLVEDPGMRLQRLPSHMAYWFGWYSFYPATGIYGSGIDEP